MSSSLGLSATIEQILRNYPIEEIGEGLTDNRVRDLLESDLVSQLQSLVDNGDLVYEASAGKGRWTSIPWVAVLDTRVTDTINEGVYVVYLFEPKQERVSLTLNQGVKRLREDRGMADARKELHARADKIRARLDLLEFSKGVLEFPDASSRNQLYGPGTIAYKQYELGEMPDEETLRTDFRQLTGAYQDLIESGDLPNGSDPDEEDQEEGRSNGVSMSEETEVYQVPLNSGENEMRRNFDRTVLEGVPSSEVPDVFDETIRGDRCYIWGNNVDGELSDFALLFGDRSSDEYRLLAIVADTAQLSEKEAEEFADAVGWEGDRSYQRVFILDELYELNLPAEKIWDLLGYNGFPQDTFSRITFDRSGSTFYEEYEDKQQFFSDVLDLGDAVGNTSSPSVWIEKTQQEGRKYKQEGKFALGKAIMAPSRDEGGYKRYETMREAEVGDVVLHLLQERHQIVGVSRIASELHEDFEGPPTDRWTEEQREQGGYLRELEDYVELDDPIEVYDDVLSNEKYTSELQRIREETDEKIIYTKRLSLNQGHYFTKVPEDFLGILADESEDLQIKLQNFGVDVPESPNKLPPAVESYDTLTEATDDIHERLERSARSNWLAGELTTTVVEDWSEVLTNFGPDSTVSPTEEVRLKQIRQLYESNESRLREDAEELGSGGLNHITKPQTLFVAFLRDLQEQAGINTNANQVKVKVILNEEYDIETDEPEDDNGEESAPSHPVLTQLDTMAPSTPVRKFTAPPDYWLTALRYGTISFEESHSDVWANIEPGEIALLHSRSEPGADKLPAQPSGIFAVGILGEKTTKDEIWWTDESQAEPFHKLVNFERLFVTSNLDRLDVSTPVGELSTEETAAQLSALTAGILEFDEVQSICKEANGISFPAQGAHGVFRGGDDNADHERPRALLEELAGRLQETSTVNAHAPFEGTLSTEPLEELYFPDGEEEDIIEQIEAALRTGKHIILTGPPGTGKTEIARRVCNYVADEYPHLYSDFQLTTATADWSTFDTVGGYMPEGSDEGGDELSFTPGVILNRLKERQTGRQVNEPIIIDELNRADIDKAFGQLFTLLSGQSVQLPYTRDGEEIELLDADQIETQPASHQYVVPDSWRIFATMNTYDKTSLYEMSYAFMRRFAFIRVGAPDLPVDDDDELDKIMHEYAKVWDIDIGPPERTEVGRVWRAMNQAVEDRAIGPAIVQDILAYVNQANEERFNESLTKAVISYIYPQLEGVPKREQILRQIAAVDRVDEDELNDAATEMLQVNIISDE